MRRRLRQLTRRSVRWQRNYREKWTGWDGGVRERGELAGGAGLVGDSEAG